METEAAEAPQKIEKQPDNVAQENEENSHSVWNYLGGWFGYTSTPATEQKPIEPE